MSFRVVKKKSELSAAHPFGQGVGDRSRQGIGEHIEGAKRRIERVEILNLFVDLAIGRRVEGAECSANENLEKEREEIEVGFGRRQAEGIDREIARFNAETQIGAAEEPGKTFKASAEIENEGIGIVFLEIGDQKIQEETFSGTRATKNHGVRRVTVMQVEKIGRAMIGFKDGQIFLPQMRIAGLTGVQGEKKG